MMVVTLRAEGIDELDGDKIIAAAALGGDDAGS